MDVSPAASAVVWPPSLRVYARKCFKNCSTEEARDEVALILKDKIAEANTNNTLWSINWDKEPLLTLPVPTGATISEEPRVGPPNTTVEQSQVADLSADLNVSDVCDEWGSEEEEEETPASETTGDLSLLFRDAEEGNLLSSESVNETTPQTRSPKKCRSPASKKGQMDRMLKYQQKLVVEKGLPKTRLQMELTPDTFQHVKSAKVCKNLFSNSQELDSSAAAPCRTFQSVTPAGGNCVESKTESVKCNSDYQKVVSSGHKNLSSLSHSRYESVKKDNLSPHISSVQSLDNSVSGKVHVLSVPELSVQSLDNSTSGNVPSVQNLDIEEESGRAGSQCKNVKEFKSSGTKQNTQTLNTESFKSEQENFQTSAQSCMQEALLPPGAIYLPSGFYVNVGPAYCGGCQLYGTLLQKLQM